VRLEIPREVADALEAVAALDGTPPDMLACMLIADGLLDCRARLVDAAAAIGRLAGDQTTSGVGEGVSPSPEPAPDPATGEGDVGAQASPVEQAAPPAADPTVAGTGEGDSPGGEAPSPDHPHRCDDCGRTFDTAAALGGHRGSHRRRRKPAGCQLDGCDDTPVKARGLCGRHYRAWEDGRLAVAPDGAPSPSDPPGDDRHVCDDCGQTFKSAAGLGSHRRVHRDQPGPRTCVNCGDTIEKGRAVRHDRCKKCDAYVRQHGTERPNPDDDGTYPCGACGETFGTAAGLGVHRGRFCKPGAATDTCEGCGGEVPGGVGRWCGVGRCVAGDQEKPWSWSRRAS
jgi:hypothetical protein